MNSLFFLPDTFQCGLVQVRIRSCFVSPATRVSRLPTYRTISEDRLSKAMHSSAGIDQSMIDRLIPSHRAKLPGGFVFLYVAALLVCVEFILHGYYRITTGAYLFSRNNPPVWAPDPHSGWTNRPSFTYRHVTPEFSVDLYTNSQGFRVSSQHEEYTVKKPDDTYRILLLGPSFAFGWGVDFEDTFSVQLGRILTQGGFASGRKVEVLNHGVPALPAANQLAWFRQVGRTY